MEKFPSVRGHNGMTLKAIAFMAHIFDLLVGGIVRSHVRASGVTMKVEHYSQPNHCSLYATVLKTAPNQNHRRTDPGLRQVLYAPDAGMGSNTPPLDAFNRRFSPCEVECRYPVNRADHSVQNDIRQRRKWRAVRVFERYDGVKVYAVFGMFRIEPCMLASTTLLKSTRKKVRSSFGGRVGFFFDALMSFE